MARSDDDIARDYATAVSAFRSTNVHQLTKNQLNAAYGAAQRDDYSLAKQLSSHLQKGVHGLKFLLGAFIERMTWGLSDGERQRVLAEKFNIDINKNMVRATLRYHNILKKWPFLFLAQNWVALAKGAESIDVLLNSSPTLQNRFGSLRELCSQLPLLLPDN